MAKLLGNPKRVFGPEQAEKSGGRPPGNGRFDARRQRTRGKSRGARRNWFPTWTARHDARTHVRVGRRSVEDLSTPRCGERLCHAGVCRTRAGMTHACRPVCFWPRPTAGGWRAACSPGGQSRRVSPRLAPWAVTQLLLSRFSFTKNASGCSVRIAEVRGSQNSLVRVSERLAYVTSESQALEDA